MFSALIYTDEAPLCFGVFAMSLPVFHICCCHLQSELLVVRKKNKRYCPVYFSKVSQVLLPRLIKLLKSQKGDPDNLYFIVIDKLYLLRPLSGRFREGTFKVYKSIERRTTNYGNDSYSSCI